jgi:hypothetical protein
VPRLRSLPLAFLYAFIAWGCNEVTNQNLIHEAIKEKVKEMLAAIQFRTSCLLVFCLKNLGIKIYKAVIFSVAFYGRETWSLTLGEEHRLRMFENSVERRIFGPQRDEVMGGWRKLHNEGLRNLYSSPHVIRMMKSRRVGWAGHIACMRRREMHAGICWESQKEMYH